MYLSLKGSLGHTPITDRVGEGPLQIAEGAAAAYSLRNLGSDSPSVVRVRRESDNNERDFTAQDISTSVLTNWVNEQITPPLDLRELTATGRDGPIIEAAAAYSLRNLSDSYAGDVVEVRRNTDGALKDFKASEVTDGTLEAWVNTSFANALPLDTSGAAAAAYSLRNLSSSYTGNVVEVRRSSDGNTAPFTAAEVTDGTLVAWVNEALNIKTYDFSTNAGGLGFPSNLTLTGGQSAGGVDDALKMSVVSTGTNTVHRCYQNISPIGSGSSLRITFRAYRPSSNVNSGKLGFSFASGFLNSSSPSQQFLSEDDAWEDFTFTATSGGSSRFYLQLASTDGSGSGKAVFNGTTGDHVYIKDLSIDVVSSTGTVSKWYDQSGNDNHATQGTPASQPKIVSGGSLVTGGLDFDGVDDYLVTTQGLIVEISQNPASVFCVAHPSNTNEGYLLTEGDGIGPYSSQFILNGSENSSSTVWVNTTEFGSGFLASKTLGGFIYNGTTFQAYLNGSADGSAGTAVINAETINQTFIATRADAITNFFDGKVEELITYKSDQSDKRRAIEENIGSTYGITLTSSKDGTVSKWYDQSTTSGVPNANHAVQTDAASQPKIVDAGALVTGGLDFDGVNDNLQYNYAITNPTSGSIFSVFNNTATSYTGVVFGIRSGTRDLIQLTSQDENESVIQVRDSGNVLVNAVASSPSRLNTNLSSAIFNKATPIYDINVNGGQFSGSSSTVLTGGITASKATIGGTDTGTSVSAVLTGTIQEIIYYNSDQSDNRTALEANIGEVYGIAGIPAYDNTVNGFVETWYDQSGNGNNATQLTASKQPKIVSAGSLVSGGLAFDGVNDRLSFASSVALSSNDFFVTSVLKVLEGDGDDITPVGNASGNRFLMSLNYDNNTSVMRADDGSFLTEGFTASEPTGNILATVQRVSNTVTLFHQSSNQATFNATGESFTLGNFGQVFPSTYSKHLLNEIIIYPSDQSANRPAIEANINNQYDIY